MLPPGVEVDSSAPPLPLNYFASKQLPPPPSSPPPETSTTELEKSDIDESTSENDSLIVRIYHLFFRKNKI